jgi:hypothetical protein
MPKIEISGRVAACASVLALAGAGLTACGGSSGSSQSHNGSSATRIGTSSTATSPSTSSSSSSGGASAAKARSQIAERLRQSKASAGHMPAGRTRGFTAQQTAFRHALGNFAGCLRQQGVKIPQPNTSGNGPILSTKGIDTSTPQYRAAVMKCRSVLIGAFRRAATQARSTARR